VANEIHATTAPTAAPLGASLGDLADRSAIESVVAPLGVGTAEERGLVERAQQGDARAVRALYLLHAEQVFRCAIMPLVRDRNLAEDLLADTFVRAIENLHRFRWQGKGLLPWLIRIGKNLCLDHLRRAGRTTAWPEGFEQQLPDTSDIDAENLLGRSQLSDVLRVRIDECMTELNPRYRRVLELRMIEKVSREDAARSMDVTIGTLDVLLFRACKAFRKVWARRYGEADSR
jgi:RNA polymerase sigma-70 factor (ECF subfamily)